VRTAAAVGVVLAALLAASGAAASPPKSAFTPAGSALAKSATLKLSDLPAGWKAAASSSGGGDFTCPTFDPDQSDLTRLGHADTHFASANGLGSASSTVGVFASAAQAQSSWNRIVRPALAGCLASLFKQGISASAGTATIVSTGPLAVRLKAPRAAAYRIVADVVTNGQKVRAWVDVLLQGRGPADTAILVTSVVSPPSASLERRLGAAIAGRLPPR
jgi:hypothetical protein